jgi:hypothetical protein
VPFEPPHDRNQPGCFHHDHIARLALRVYLACFVEKHLCAFIYYAVFDHFLFSVNGNNTRFGVQLGFHVLCSGGSHCASIGRDHRRLNSGDDHVLGELLFFQHFVECQRKIILCHRTAPKLLIIKSEEVGAAHFSVTFVIGLSLTSEILA